MFVATKVNYYVKVINSSKKGLAGYNQPSYSSTKQKTYSNGTAFYVDRMATDTSGIWYRHMIDKTWVMFKTSSGKSYLKSTKETAKSKELKEWYKEQSAEKKSTATVSKTSSTLSGMMNFGQVVSQIKSGTSTAEKMSTVIPTPGSSSSLVVPPGTTNDPYPIKTDIVQQNSKIVNTNKVNSKKYQNTLHYSLLTLNLPIGKHWQGWKESNPPLEFWRLLFYR